MYLIEQTGWIISYSNIAVYQGHFPLVYDVLCAKCAVLIINIYMANILHVNPRFGLISHSKVKTQQNTLT